MKIDLNAAQLEVLKKKIQMFLNVNEIMFWRETRLRAAFST